MFFRNILASLPQTPCHLYIDGVSYEDLRNALRFMYLGEVQVEKDNLDFFMSACKKLELLGLSEDNIESFNDELEGGENKISTDIVKNEEDITKLFRLGESFEGVGEAGGELGPGEVVR